MPDTSAARAAIRNARDKHRDVIGGMSTAELKLQAAGGLLRDEDPLPYPEDSHVWTDHAQDGLQRALAACDELRAALLAAVEENAKLARQAIVEEGSPLRCGSHMRHRDESTELCVLHKDHRVDDTDCVDRHGCRRRPMISQSTIDQAEYWREELNRDA
jgi:hypothetical protein